MTIKMYTPSPVKHWFQRNRWIIVGVGIIVALAITVRVIGVLGAAGAV